jgi:hypothetical protein
MAYAVFVIVGAVVIVFARISEDRRGELGFLVFIASLFALVGSSLLLTYPGR